MYTLLLTVNVVTRVAFMLAFHTETGRLVAHSESDMDEIGWRNSGKIMWDITPRLNIDMYLCFDDEDTDIYSRQVSWQTYTDLIFTRAYA